MTPQEVIEWLLAIQSKYIHGGDEAYDEDRKLAIKTAISALEKQIPKKVNPKKVDDPFGRSGGECPVCGYARLYDNYKFCHKCGQALDWGDSE